MNPRAIIVDDEESGIDILRLLLNAHAPEVRVIATATSAAKAIAQIEDYRPDVVFLDISMPEMDGFQLLSRLQWKQFSLVFITAHQEFGLKALRQNAVDYLLKPVDFNELKSAVQRVKHRMLHGQGPEGSLDYGLLRSINLFATKKLAVPSKDSVESVAASDIVYLESKSNYTFFSLLGARTILSPRTLKEYDQLLCDNLSFMRVHHSYIVNLHQVQRFLKESDVVVMKNGQFVHLSRNRRGHFLNWLTGLAQR